MSAPSFSSFPPSFASFPDLDAGPSTPAGARTPSRRIEDKKHEKARKDKGSKEKKRKREQRKDVGDIDNLYQGGNQILDDERVKAKQDNDLRDDGRAGSPPLFYSDPRGDPLNVSYGGLYAGDVPKHNLVGRGTKILGLGNAWTATYRSGKGVEVGIGGRQKMPQLTDPKSRALLASAPTRSLLSSSGPYKYEEIDGFLRLPSRRGRDDDQAYRSITKHATNSDSETSASDAEHYSTDSDSDTTPLTSYQEKSKSLDLQLNADPSFVPTWLLLLSHSLSTIPITSKNAIKARSEITISIMSRALSAHPQNASSKILRLKYLKAGEEVWHESKLRAEWEEAWKVGGVEIWMEWLEWRMRGRNKGVSGFVEDGMRVLTALGTEDEVSKVRVLWRLAVAFHNAGFVERATALLQAQTELTFKVPHALRGLSIDDQLDALDEFWESEVPRVGEPDAKGWANWVETGRATRVPASSKVTVQTREEQVVSDPYTQWSIQESSADRELRLPTRAVDETDESDPYATILFSDIRPLLFSLQSTRAMDAIRLVWLSVLGLHIPGFTESLSPDRHANADDRWCYIHLTNPSYLAAIFPSDVTQRRLTTDAYAGVIVGREREYSSGFGPVKNWGYGVIGPLENVDGRGCLWTTEDVQGVDESFVRRIFAQLRLGVEDYEWDTFSLAFEAAINVKSALKVSRSFLSTARNSLPHWAAHGRLERFRGRTDDARKVYQTVLVASARPTTVTGMSQLWWDWAEMEWLAGGSDAALQVVVRSVGVDGTAGVTILRARRNLEEAVVAGAQWKDREAWIKLLALLENLTSSMDAALSVFDRHLVNLEKGEIAHESLTVACLVMVYRQGIVLRKPSPPSILRARVEEAVNVYPNSTVVLGMFLEGEKGQGVWGRVRGLLGEETVGVVRDKDVARRVMEVWIAGWERGRWEGEKERIRSGFAVAVDSERTRNSAIIWRIYIEFEVRAGQMQLAKKMLFRAIGECPLVKELYLLAFGPLRSVFSQAELNSFADTMAERELRMRKGLDEMLNGWEAITGENEGSEDSEDGEDEIEHNAKELVRLRPY